MTRTCRSCPQPHPIYLQAEPEWYRPTFADHARDVAQIIAYGFATVVATFVVWSLLVALLLGGGK